MALASHLGPWLLGTVKNTTGTTSGQIRNMGATVVNQSAPLTVSDTTAKTIAVIPAGSSITGITIDTDVAFNSTTDNVITVQTGNATTGLTNNVASGQALATFTKSAANIAVGRAIAGATSGFAYTTTAANVVALTNVGTSDLILQGVYSYTGTLGTTGSAKISVNYVVRNSDGSSSPTSSQA